jgi:hypothetical protein
MQTVVEIEFDAADVPGGADAILSGGQCEKEVAKVARYEVLGRIDVTLRFDDNDARIPKVLALLADASATAWVDRRDIYTEDDLQAARLLFVSRWWKSVAAGGLEYGTTYDRSQACPQCGTGARQTSPLVIGDDDMRTVDKHRVAGSSNLDLLVRDTDVERLIAAQVTGANFWPACFKAKSGNVTELRWQQAVIESVMPPLAASSSLDRKGVCPTCGRGGFTNMMNQPARLVYRAQDLANIQDFNLTWELFGDFGKTEDGGIRGLRWSHPWVLVTPKVMNLLRGKTKKELKYQGCNFIPIWIEGEADQPKSPSR